MSEPKKVIGADIDAVAKPSKTEAGGKVGPLVEDTSVVGGVDATGAPRIVSRTPDGGVQEDVKPTDPHDR